jgi:hypothetical protein
MANAQHQSATAEHGTPTEVIEAARNVLQGIELDPASNALFNKLVRAERYFNERNNGFIKPWDARSVFLNPPGGYIDDKGRRVVMVRGQGFTYPKTGKPAPRGTSSMAAWWVKLIDEYEAWRAKSAIFIGFSLEVLQRTQMRNCTTPLEFPFCVPAKRLQFLEDRGKKLVKGTAPTHANVIVLLPQYQGGSRDEKQVDTFIKEFSHIGKVVVPV